MKSRLALLSALVLLGGCAIRGDLPFELARSDRDLAAHRAVHVVVRTDGPVPPAVVAECVSPYVTTLRDTALREEADRASRNMDPADYPRLEHTMRDVAASVGRKVADCGRGHGFRHFELGAGPSSDYRAEGLRPPLHEQVRRLVRDHEDNRILRLMAGKPSLGDDWASLLVIRAILYPQGRTAIEGSAAGAATAGDPSGRP